MGKRQHSTPREPSRVVVVMTDANTRDAHLITDQAFAAGRHSGRYHAICGADVLAASLTTAERGHCEGCAREQPAR